MLSSVCRQIVRPWGARSVQPSFTRFLSANAELKEVASETAPDAKSSSLESFRISPSRIDLLKKQGIQSLFEIQVETYDPLFDGRDLIAKARTGSGKTLAFALPIIEKISATLPSRKSKLPSCLVMAPTRELARQVSTTFENVAPEMSTTCVYGGAPYDQQLRALKSGVNILVATPGRLMDLINRGDVSLSAVNHVVLDEADEMMRVGFKEQVVDILRTAPSTRQTVLFSATMPPWVKSVCKQFLKDPLIVDTVGTTSQQVISDVKHMAIETPRSREGKVHLLADLLSFYRHDRCIVFTATKRMADELVNSSIIRTECQVLHGDVAQNTRDITLNAFREGVFPVLIATDVAARGLDIPEIDLVIQFDFPQDSEGYVHRAGRTGRAGRSGIAIVMCDQNEKRDLKELARSIGREFEMIKPPSPRAIAQQAAGHAGEKVINVDRATVAVFRDRAAAILDGKDPEEIVAASLAVIAGYQDGLTHRSLLSMELGFQTLLLTGRFRSKGHAMQVIGKVAPESVGKIGRMEIVPEGIVFDVKPSIAQILLQSTEFTTVEELPELILEEEEATSRSGFSGFRRDGGRGGDRGSDRRRGGDRDSDRGRSMRRRDDDMGDRPVGQSLRRDSDDGSRMLRLRQSDGDRSGSRSMGRSREDGGDRPRSSRR